MTPRQLIDDLQLRGISLSADDGRIKMRGCLTALTEQDRQVIREIRGSLIQFLSILNLKIGQRVWKDGEPVYVWEVYSSGRVGVLRSGDEDGWPRFFDMDEITLTQPKSEVQP
jgi:hypothetical protein